MNICFVTSEYVSPTRGGVERVTDVLIKGLSKRGIQICIVSGSQTKTPEELRDDNYVFPTFDEDSNAIFLAEILEKHRIDVIINQSHHSYIFNICVRARKSANCKLVSVFHTSPDYLLKDLYDKMGEVVFNKRGLKRLCALMEWGLRFPYRYYIRKNIIFHKFQSLYSDSDAVVLLSDTYRDAFMRLGKLHDKKKLYAISNPIELSPNDIEPQCKQKILLFVGRIEFQAKRPDRIIKIWEKLYRRFPEWTLYVIGDGLAKDELTEYCKDRHIRNVKFVGRINPVPYYKKASILCVVSTYEGFGLVLAEALSNGVIPVAYNSFGAARDIIMDKSNGFLIRPYQEEEYMECLADLMENDGMREKMFKSVSETNNLKSFDLDSICDKWINLINKL